MNLQKLIEKQQPIAKQQQIAARAIENETNRRAAQDEEQPAQELPTTEEQVQMDSTTTIPRNEHTEEQVADPSTKKNTRGSTQMPEVHARQERKLITLNSNNQPIGPTKDVVLELSSFLGTLARNAALCRLDIENWRYMDTKDDLWAYTKEKYDIPEAAQDWALEVIGSAWRRHKHDLKKLCYKSCASNEARMAKRPLYVPECQFKELIYWDSEKHKKMAETNTMNRKKSKNPHTAGKISFALIRNDLEKKKESVVSQKELFVVTRTRHPECSYKESNEDTTSKIVEMDEIEKQQSVVDSESTVDAFSSVMGPEHPGRLRLHGRGVTKRSLKRKARNSEPTSNAQMTLCNKCMKGYRKWRNKEEPVNKMLLQI